MSCAAADRHLHRPRAQRGPLTEVRSWIAALLLLCGFAAVQAQSQQTPPPVEVVALAAMRSAEAVLLDYQLNVVLPAPVEEAARRGVPLYFVANATLWRPRWYWRDERVARVRREWRLTYQPLTSSWRVSQGGLGQSHASLDEAMSIFTRSTGWRVADAAQAEADGKTYVEFDWVLDTSQLPRPLQIGVTGVGGGSDWALGIERTMKLEAAPAAAAPPSSAGPRASESR
jgi:Domain of unknown function (DUF4390)